LDFAWTSKDLEISFRTVSRDIGRKIGAPSSVNQLLKSISTSGCVQEEIPGFCKFRDLRGQPYSFMELTDNYDGENENIRGPGPPTLFFLFFRSFPVFQRLKK